MRGHRQDPISLLSLAITLTYTLLIFPSLATSNCFLPNQEPGDSQYQSCNNTNTDTSMCCASNRDYPFADRTNGTEETADSCLNNGLCINIVGLFNYSINDWDNSTTYWRSLCNSLDWGDGCLDICTRSSENGLENGRVQMTSCNGRPDSPYWCCGEDNTDCCGTSDAIRIAAMVGDPLPPVLNSGLSNGAKAGIGVGVAVGVIAIIAAGVAFWYIRRRRRRNAAAAANDNANTNAEMTGVGAAAEVPAPPYEAQATVQSPHELEGNGVGNRVEKPAGTGDVRHELPGESAGGGRSVH